MTTDEMVAFIFVRFTCRVGFEVKLYNYIANSSKGCLNRDPSWNIFRSCFKRGEPRHDIGSLGLRNTISNAEDNEYEVSASYMVQVFRFYGFQYLVQRISGDLRRLFWTAVFRD